MLVEEYGRFENLVFQREEGERTIINDLNEGFNEVPKELQRRGEVLVLVGVDIGKDIILWLSLRRGCNIEVINRGLDTSGIEYNIRWRNLSTFRRFFFVTSSSIINEVSITSQYSTLPDGSETVGYLVNKKGALFF